MSLEELHGSNLVLSNLESLLCSGLESSHRSIASRSITLWNTLFGSSGKAFDYPSQVQNALLRLRPLAEIQLPFLPDSVLTEDVIDERQHPLEFAESQEDVSSFLPTNSMVSVLNKHRTPQKIASTALYSSPGARKCRETTPEVRISVESSASRKRPREHLISSQSKKSRKRQVTPKLRHDDSQVQFQAVEKSSPLADESNTSQILTDRQLEVKERQIAEAAMFPDLRSSPRQKARAASVKKQSGVEHGKALEPELPSRRSSSKTRAPTPINGNAPRQITPVPILASEDDNFMVSSPTPKRRCQGADESGPPSSPPVVPVPDPELPTIEIDTIFEQELPSSPPQMSEAGDVEAIQHREYPSAQLDPLAVPKPATPSMVDTPELTLRDPLETENNKSEETGEVDQNAPTSTNPPSISNVARDKPAEVSASLEPKTVSLPSTPPRTRARTTRQSANSPPFVDARSSPFSSDRDNANDEIFEDAVSSPRLPHNKGRQAQTSPILSESDEPGMDDSSILRMMEEFDEPSEASSAVATPGKNTNKPRRSLRMSSNKTPSRVTDGAMRKAALKNATTSKKPINRENIPSTSSMPEPTSPMSFLVPETPAAKPMGSPEKALVIGHDPDAEETIIVDTSSLEQPYEPVNFKKRRREQDDMKADQGK